MASSARLPILRHLTSCHARSLRAASQQQRWAQVHDVRFLATHQTPSRSVLEKYRDKLDRKAREEGHADIDTLKKAYADKITALRREAAAAVGPSIPVLSGSDAIVDDAATTTHSQQPPQKPSGSSSSSVKPLSAILDLPKARELPVAELSAIWRLRHASRDDSLCAVIPAATYAAMEAAARRSPQFVLPLPHPSQGAEMHFLQWTWDAASGTSTVLFTRLAEYKARGEWAPPHTSVTHHPDLAADRGVVLMQGAVVKDRGVKADDARWLVMCLQRFYGAWDGKNGDDVDGVGRERAEERRRLLEWFAAGDERFTIERLMEEAERMG